MSYRPVVYRTFSPLVFIKGEEEWHTVHVPQMGEGVGESKHIYPWNIPQAFIRHGRVVP